MVDVTRIVIAALRGRGGRYSANPQKAAECKGMEKLQSLMEGSPR